jgi:NADPH-dependent curcumin reductase CurA
VALCGGISQYNSEKPSGPANFALAVTKRLSLRGFIVSDHMDRIGAMLGPVSEWLASGKLVADETIVDGLDNAVDAFLGMLRGTNTGKALVRLS